MNIVFNRCFFSFCANTSYFFASDENRWRLIASFLRPKTHVFYTRAHSFLENFIPGQGY
ncbi:MAG: DUF3472 domain-containing protein, partial [Petrimonas sp.]|nr:DUF3472 domain-containing protein [Petrimonas sp.]